MPEPTAPVVTRIWAQGDCLLVRVATLPPGLREGKRDETGAYVVAHSETGHHHIVRDPTARLFLSSERADDPIFGFLEVSSGDTRVEHLRTYDTHEPRVLAPGVWRIHHQRQDDGASVRRVVD